MVKLVHKLTGLITWVADDRVEEYKAAGYKPAAEIEPEKPKKAVVKKKK